MNDKIVFNCDEEYGDSRITIYKIDISDVGRVHEMFPETHCTHDYDCCGNWYDSRAIVIHEDKLYNFALVRQSSHRNV